MTHNSYIVRYARYAAYVFVLIGILATPQSAALSYGESTSDGQEGHTFVLPKDWFKTQNDANALLRWREVLYIFMNNYYRKLTIEEIMQASISGGVTSLDPHTRIMDEKEYVDMQTEISGSFGGLGMEVQKNNGGKPGVLVIAPIDDTPASRAGIKAKDIILEIDGKSTDVMSLKDAVGRMRGEPNTGVTLLVWREGLKKPLSIRLTREVIKIQYVKYELKDNGIGYIRITGFGGETVPALVQDAVKKLTKKNNNKKLSGVILDLRNNPGGLLDVTHKVYSLFLNGDEYFPKSDNPSFDEIMSSRVTISEESRGRILNNRKYYIGRSSDITNGAAMIVLVNGGSASASEIVAKTLQVYGRALVVGSRKSFGKGTVQSIIELQTGGALAMTTSQYLIGPEGCEQAIQNVGVIPDILVKEEDDAVSELTREESKLENSVTRSTISNENCKYRYKFPESQREMVLHMLRVMNLTAVQNE